MSAKGLARLLLAYSDKVKMDAILSVWAESNNDYELADALLHSMLPCTSTSQLQLQPQPQPQPQQQTQAHTNSKTPAAPISQTPVAKTPSTVCAVKEVPQEHPTQAQPQPQSQAQGQAQKAIVGQPDTKLTTSSPNSPQPTALPQSNSNPQTSYSTTAVLGTPPNNNNTKPPNITSPISTSAVRSPSPPVQATVMQHSLTPSSRPPGTAESESSAQQKASLSAEPILQQPQKQEPQTPPPSASASSSFMEQLQLEFQKSLQATSAPPPLPYTSPVKTSTRVKKAKPRFDWISEVSVPPEEQYPLTVLFQLSENEVLVESLLRCGPEAKLLAWVGDSLMSGVVCDVLLTAIISSTPSTMLDVFMLKLCTNNQNRKGEKSAFNADGSPADEDPTAWASWCYDRNSMKLKDLGYLSKLKERYICNATQAAFLCQATDALRRHPAIKGMCVHDKGTILEAFVAACFKEHHGSYALVTSFVRFYMKWVDTHPTFASKSEDAIILTWPSHDAYSCAISAAMTTPSSTDPFSGTSCSATIDSQNSADGNKRPIQTTVATGGMPLSSQSPLATTTQKRPDTTQQTPIPSVPISNVPVPTLVVKTETPSVSTSPNTTSPTVSDTKPSTSAPAAPEASPVPAQKPIPTPTATATSAPIPAVTESAAAIPSSTSSTTTASAVEIQTTSAASPLVTQPPTANSAITTTAAATTTTPVSTAALPTPAPLPALPDPKIASTHSQGAIIVKLNTKGTTPRHKPNANTNTNPSPSTNPNTSTDTTTTPTTSTTTATTTTNTNTNNNTSNTAGDIVFSYMACCGLPAMSQYCCLRELWPDFNARHQGTLVARQAPKRSKKMDHAHMPVWSCCGRLSLSPGCVSPALGDEVYSAVLNDWFSQYGDIIDDICTQHKKLMML